MNIPELLMKRNGWGRKRSCLVFAFRDCDKSL